MTDSSDLGLEPLPKRVGPYRILRLIGEGGMGAVYEAEQSVPVRRRVAIKVIKLGMDTKQVVSRFEAERQALAVMDHPNIARMLDAGATEDGRPYFVMELVHGEPITEYCDHFRLTTKQRIGLFLQACRAVQHAHQKGVIHRDLKPRNMLVEVTDGEPVLKVIDFGIAKAVGMRLTDATLLTQIGQIVGSPAYMSPEQAERSELDVDTRTDVYSLGVVLYELLAGALPFDRSFFSKPDFIFQYLLRDTDAPRPSARFGSLADTQETVARNRSTEARALRRELNGDLDWIVMRAMEKDRIRRYDTPTALACDLERYLSLQPVEARPPTVRYRLSRFVRRHRTAVSTAALVAAILLGSSAALASQATRLAEQRDTAEEMASFLEDLFTATDPYEGGDRRDTLSVAAFVRIGAERVEAELDDRPAVQARMEVVLGRVLRNLGRFEDSRRLFEDAVRIYEERNGVGSVEAIGSRQLLGFVLLDMGEARAAADMFQASREARIAAGIDRDRRFGDALSGLGNANMTLGDFAAAESAYREALEVYEEGGDAGAVKLAQGTSNLAGALIRQARYDEAEPLLRRAIRTGSTEMSADHPNMLSFANNLAYLLGEVGRLDEAEALHRETLELTRSRLAAPHPAIARSLNNLGTLLLQMDRAEEAEPLLAEAVAMRTELHGPDHGDVAASIYNHADALRRMGRRDEAVAAYGEALRIFEAALGPDHPRVATALGALARVAHERGDHATAFERLQRADRIRSARLGEDHPLTASVRLDLGRELTELGVLTTAEAMLRAAYDALETRQDEQAGSWRLAHERLAELYEAKGERAEAERYRREASRLAG